MEFTITATVKVTAAGKAGDNKSEHLATDFRLDVSDNLDPKAYIENGHPNKTGSEAMTSVLVEGLIGCIHYAHHKGYRDSAAHLRYIIAKLEEGFAAVATVKPGKF